MNREVISTKQFFESRHITLSEDWLESCIEWHRGQNPNTNQTIDALHKSVYEQWLLLDLRDTEVSILPGNLTNSQKTVLNGIYSLQMMHVTDISQPHLAQLQKLRNINTNTADEEYPSTRATPKRMLQLLLTDGVQEVEAIEYKPISILRISLPPGIKIKITGPVTIRRGQMMLESHNVEILGGEVEELLVSNATENILAKRLNMPLNQQPNVKHDDLPNVTAVQNTNTTLNSQPIKHQEELATQNTIDKYIVLSINSDSPTPAITNKLSLKITSYFNTTNRQSNTNQVVNSNQRSNKKIEPTSKAYSFETSSSLSTSITKDEECMIIEECNDKQEIEKDLGSKPPNPFDNEPEFDVLEGIDIDGQLDLIDEQIAKKSKIMNISELNGSRIKDGNFTINAGFKSVSGKLGVTNEKWSLRIVVQDDTGDLEAWVHPDLITRTINCSAVDLLAMKQAVLNKDENVRNLALQKITELKDKIKDLQCQMEVTFQTAEEYPVIVNFKC